MKKMVPCTNSQAGLLTLELIVSVLLSIPILLGLAWSLRFLAHHYGQIEIEHNQVYRELRLKNYLRQVLHDLDSHRFYLLPRIHNRGQILFTDGTENPIMHSAGLIRPSPQSSAISGLQLNILKTYAVVRSQPQSKQVLYFACPRYGVAIESDEFHSFLGLSDQGFFELTGKVQAHQGRPLCKDFLFAPQKSMAAPPFERFDSNTIALLIPVTRNYTFYVDKRGIFRYLSHAGESNIENQPLIADVSRFGLSTFSIQSNGIMVLKSVFSIDHGRSQQLSINNVLERIYPYNFLMNQP